MRSARRAAAATIRFMFTPVLYRGESKWRKRLLARRFHARRSRALVWSFSSAGALRPREARSPPSGSHAEHVRSAGRTSRHAAHQLSVFPASSSPRTQRRLGAGTLAITMGGSLPRRATRSARRGTLY
jgi:hypothetical protein